MPFTVTTDTREGIDVVTVVGEVDIYTAPDLRAHLKDLIGLARHLVVVDLSGVAVLDSSGMGVLVGALKRAREHGGTLALTGVSSGVYRVLRVTGLGKVFAFYPDSTDAIHQLLSAA